MIAGRHKSPMRVERYGETIATFTCTDVVEESIYRCADWKCCCILRARSFMASIGGALALGRPQLVGSDGGVLSGGRSVAGAPSTRLVAMGRVA